jgi:hypothetical protein
MAIDFKNNCKSKFVDRQGQLGSMQNSKEYVWKTSFLF